MAYIKLGNMGRKRPIQDETGGSDLPEVTSADEGKVLAVNASGEWVAEKWVGYDAVIDTTITDDDGWVLSNYEILKGSFSTLLPKVSASPLGNVKILISASLNVSDYTGTFSTFASAVVDEEGIIITIYWGDYEIAFLLSSSNTLSLFN